MLKKYSQVFLAIIFLSDISLISLSWITAFMLRFYSGIIPISKGIPNIKEFVVLLVFLLPIYSIIFRYFGLYEPMRSSSKFDETKKVIAASILSTLIFTTLLYLVKEVKYSRPVFVYFFLISTTSLCIFRFCLRTLFGFLRKKGYNLRHILVIGDGQAAKDIEKKLVHHAEYGFKVIGFLSSNESLTGSMLGGLPILGTYKEIKKIIRDYSPDQVIIALPFEHLRFLRPILNLLHDEAIAIKIVPDFYQYFTLRKGIEMLENIPIINLRESPLYGWNSFLKRLFDIIVSSIVLFLLSPIFLAIAFAIKLSSPGPVFYRQKRMGLDENNFDILKFRSMQTDAEKDCGPIWAKENDCRRTKVGIFLRKYNLDELPQFINVLAGDMSIIGPRPEREEFMQDFKKRIPEYMLRHNMKAGITGWAQINGLRGNTSIEKRTEYDLFYIENWSIFFDISIFLKSFLATKNAY